MKIKFIFFITFCIVLHAENKIISQDKKPIVLSFTGLPCAGKTTLAKTLHKIIPNSVVLDADEVRSTINKDLYFSAKDRKENLRRVSQIAILMSKSSSLVILSFINPYESTRQYMRKTIEDQNIKFIEVFVDASLKKCMERDVKGMYKKAMEGKISNFTGISKGVSAIYKKPKKPDLICNTEKKTVDECINDIISILNISHPYEKHAVFIGRWSPFHKGHWEIMKKVYEENKKRPLLVLVRNTKTEYWSAETRKKMVETALNKMKIPNKVMIIPDIDSINWGRTVGYKTRMIDVDKIPKQISGTKIREMIRKKDKSWKDFLCPGVPEIIIKNIH